MKVVIGQGSCGVATGARKTAAEFEKQIADKNLDIMSGSRDAWEHVILNRS